MKVFLITTYLLFLFSCDQANKKDTQTELAFLQHAPIKWDSLFNAGNASDLAALYTDDVISMPYDMASIKGIKAQQQELENLIRQYPGIQHHTLVDEILTNDSFAIERAHYTMIYPASASSKQVTETGRHIMCRKKINGKWKITWEIWNRDKPL